MAISEQDVRHVATLARLALSDEQVTTLQSELSSILDHIDTIQKLDLEGVEPTAHPLDMVNVTRADEHRPGLTQEQALANAPDSAEGAFLIPRIVGVGGEG
jgi:aspartyl-tRNA(Asn)/glutamyl-tRNA(Gln) amidotransferase subunit C